jgi:ATP-binding cassette subfamily F protein 3
MPLVTLNNIHKSFGPEHILQGLNLQIHPNTKAGLIGPNGSGKTTIFNLILQKISPDIGSVNIRKNIKIGYLPQEPKFDPSLTVIQQLHAGFENIYNLKLKLDQAAENLAKAKKQNSGSAAAKYEKLSRKFELAGGYDFETNAKANMDALGLKPQIYNTPTTALSGGQRSRLALALAITSQADLLLLDEPTNHLDLTTTAWLENFLKNYPGSVLLISHDRYLLDSVTTSIINLNNKKTNSYPGNYSHFLQLYSDQQQKLQKQYEKRTEMINKTRDFIARNKDQEGMRGTARGRKTRLEKLLRQNPDYLEKPGQQKTVNFEFTKETAKTKLIFRAQNLEKSFGSLKLFSNLTFDVTQGQKLLITGPNGTGKTTLLKIIMKNMQPTHGSAKLAKNITTGYLDQHAGTLDQNTTVIEEAKKANPELNTEQLRNLLGSFLFTGQDVFKNISNLSGGQQNRLMLCKLVLSQPDLLILDEPTNHLDIPSREMLENALNDYPGTIIAVSHDRFFIDKIADDLLIIGADRLGQKKLDSFEFVTAAKPCYQGYSKILKERLNLHAQKIAKAENTRKIKESKKQKAKTPSHLRQFNKYSPDQIEKQILDLEEHIENIREKFGEETYYKNPEKLKNLQKKFDQANEKLDLLYRAYDHRTS